MVACAWARRDDLPRITEELLKDISLEILFYKTMG